jgi:hypothetical protein
MAEKYGDKATAGNAGNGGGRRGSGWRIGVWALAVLILLLVPLVAMQFSDEMNWGLFDFIFAGALLFGTGLIFELAVRKSGNFAYRAAAAVALAAAFILIWVNAAVGLIGSEDDPANLMFGGVLAVGIIGTVVARFQPDAMARALLATAVAQALAGVIALAAGLGAAGPIWPLDILGLTGFFTALWLISAWLFRKAAREIAPAGPAHAG